MEFSLRPLGFMQFLQNNNHQAVNEMKWIENWKIQSKTAGILKESLRVIVSVWVCLCVLVVVAYYCVRMCEWCIVYVYTKVHAQRVVFTGC